MENELKDSSRNFPSEKFAWSEFSAEWKMAFKTIYIVGQWKSFYE